jgi:4-hydroxybenzoyl-CoA reductase subunit beta
VSLPRFAYSAATSVEEACAFAAPDTMFVAGGTDLLVGMKQRIQAPARLIGLAGIPELRGVAYAEDCALRIGAAATITELADWALAAPESAALGEAALKTSSPLLRNAGTVGGNLCLDTRCSFYNQPPIFRARWGPCLKAGGDVCHAVRRSRTCHAVYSGDLAGPLIAWGARATIAAAAGRRTIPLEDLFTGDGLHPLSLESDEILVEIEVPTPPPHTRFSYQKLRLRDSFDFPLMGVSLFLQLDGSRAGALCRNARVVLSAAGPAPVVVREAGDLLVGRDPTEELAADLAARLRARAQAVGNTATSATYRRDMIEVLVRRALRAMDR